MRQLGKTELYQYHLSQGERSTMEAVLKQKLNNDVGVIAPEHIQTELLQLKTKSSRSSQFQLLSESLALYEKRGLIRLFNLANSAGGRAPIPTFMPWLGGIARNRAKNPDSYSGQGQDKVIFMNMYRIGHWSADESSYDGLAALTDLYSCLESGLIAYKLTAQSMADKVFNDKIVIEYLTKIYTNMVAQAIIKTKVPFGGQSSFQNDAGLFIIARFFLLYVLEKPDTDIIDDFAYLVTQNKSSMSALKSFEETSMIDYESLSGFLKTFGEAFYNEKINLGEFENNWVRMYGEGLIFALEYVPYLLHFLFAALHGAVLGGSSRLSTRDDIKKLGLARLYNAVVAALR